MRRSCGGRSQGAHRLGRIGRVSPASAQPDRVERCSSGRMRTVATATSSLPPIDGSSLRPHGAVVSRRRTALPIATWPGHDPERRELDAATSSDALLMSIFCHPGAFSGSSSLRHLLGTVASDRLDFGYMPRIPLITHHVERTEVDLRIGDLLIEAKLTESDFQTVRRPRMERYLNVRDLFAMQELPCSGDLLLHYQLLRGALAAHAEAGRRYCLLCDARRPDLIDAWYAVMRAVRDVELRSRLTVVTWQEIAGGLPSPLQTWLSEKYGIEG